MLNLNPVSMMLYQLQGMKAKFMFINAERDELVNEIMVKSKQNWLTKKISGNLSTVRKLNIDNPNNSNILINLFIKVPFKY